MKRKAQVLDLEMKQQQHAMKRFYRSECEALTKKEEAKAEAWLREVWLRAEAQAEKEVDSLRAMQQRLVTAMDRPPQQQQQQQLSKMEQQVEEAQARALAKSQAEARKTWRV